jgi:hypothetical protein
VKRRRAIPFCGAVGNRDGYIVATAGVILASHLVIRVKTDTVKI